MLYERLLMVVNGGTASKHTITVITDDSIEYHTISTRRIYRFSYVNKFMYTVKQSKPQ